METARIIRKAGRRQVGETVAGYAGAGVRVDEGSAVDTQEQVTKERRARRLPGAARWQPPRARAADRRHAAPHRWLMQQSAGYVNAVGSALQSGSSAMRSNGWRTNGPGFSGQQAPAPVTTLTPRAVGSY
jgi:hypothetical protein